MKANIKKILRATCKALEQIEQELCEEGYDHELREAEKIVFACRLKIEDIEEA